MESESPITDFFLGDQTHLYKPNPATSWNGKAIITAPSLSDRAAKLWETDSLFPLDSATFSPERYQTSKSPSTSCQMAPLFPPSCSWLSLPAELVCNRRFGRHYRLHAQMRYLSTICKKSPRRQKTPLWTS